MSQKLYGATHANCLGLIAKAECLHNTCLLLKRRSMGAYQGMVGKKLCCLLDS